MKVWVEKSEAKGQGRPRKEAHFRVSLPAVGGLGGALALGLVWVFILGVLVGRGYKPEDSVPELARIMPGQAANAMPNAGQLTEQGLIKPEDLQFYDKLKVADDSRTAKQAAAPAHAPEKQKSSPKPAPKPEQSANAKEPESKAPPQTAARPGAPTAKPTTKPTAKPAVNKEEPQKAVKAEGRQFRYIYQTASFREYAMARAFQDKVEDLGLATDMEVVEIKGVTWRRVNVFFTGVPEETRELKEKLKTVGVDRVILRSKTPL